MAESFLLEDGGSEDDLDLDELIQRQFAGLIGTFLTCLPGKVVGVDLERGVMSVKPAGGRRERNPDTGEMVARRFGVVSEVRIAYPAGGAGGVTYDVEVGDEVLLHITSTCLDQWQGGDQGVPEDGRRNVLTDAIGYPGARFPHTPGATIVHGDDVRAGGPDVPPKSRVARQLDLEILADAIQGAVDGIGFGSALKAALTAAGWPNCTSVLRAK